MAVAQIYNFVWTSTQAALMHNDNIMQADNLKRWINDPENKDLSVAGDDRTPPWTWQTYLYHHDGLVAVPQENVCAVIRGGASLLRKGKGSATYKKESQSGIVVNSEYCEFFSNGKPVPMAPIAALESLPFTDQAKAVEKLGLTLHVKRAKLPSRNSKVVRVRPKFAKWQVRGSITVTDPILTEAIVRQIFELAGKKVGMFDWRPGSPQSPGPYGTFTSQLTAA